MIYKNDSQTKDARIKQLEKELDEMRAKLMQERLHNDDTLMQLDGERDKRSEMVRERLRKLGLSE